MLLVVFILRLSGNRKAEPSVDTPSADVVKRPHPVATEYLRFIEAQLDSFNNVGAALTIVRKDEVLLMKTFGVKQCGSNDSVDIHTVFRLASVSKGFAGILACILEKKGVLSLQDKVVSYLPGFRLRDTSCTENLRVEHLLSHTTGLAPHAFDNLIEDGKMLKSIINDLSEVQLSATPGKLYSYQNVIFSLFDTISYLTSGNTYSSLVEKHIFRPLHMRDASVGSKVFAHRNSNVALPHSGNTTSQYCLPVNLNYYNIAPAAGVNASISDLSRWLQALLGHDPEILDTLLLSKISQPFIETPLQRRYTRYWDKIEEKSYSLGWRIYKYKGRKIIYHGGYVKGYRAEIAFCPEENIGLAFVQNSPNTVASICVPAFFNTYFNYMKMNPEPAPENYVFEGFKFKNDTMGLFQGESF